MNLKGKTLDEWLKQAKDKDFPNNNRDRYFTRYENWANYLYNNVHSQVNAGSQIADGGYLTDHGPDHVKTVILRASELVSANSCHLTGYEVYLLLGAIHSHDVGNIYGREGHELKAEKILEHLGKLVGDDDIEKRCILKIAQAHGGWPKDKIDTLPKREPILGRYVRMQMLAAILKFADELADERLRAARFITSEGLLPPESEIFHHFALSLHSVVIDTKEQHEVNLTFSLNKTQVAQTLGKIRKGENGHKEVEQVFLFDEIIQRTWKSHLERIYCMRFLTPDIRIDRINVKIEFFDNYNQLHDLIGYRLEERGYPDYPLDNIYKLCPELTLPDSSERLTGELLKSRLEQMEKRNDH